VCVEDSEITSAWPKLGLGEVEQGGEAEGGGRVRYGVVLNARLWEFDHLLAV
jgi:hypothetical protein